VYSDVCVVILAGGRSSRMGFDKALLRIGGKPLIQSLADLAAQLAGEVLISTNDPTHYLFLNLPIVEDTYKGQGPLAGLHAGMARTKKSLVLLLGCDLPNASRMPLGRIVDGAPGFDAVVPRTSDGRLHPHCAVYRRTCLDLLREQLEAGRNKAAEFLSRPGLHVRVLDPEEGGFSDSDLVNLNTPEDLKMLAPAGDP